MPGLQLSSALSGGASYTPTTPASASSPTAANVSQKAFGIQSVSPGGDGSTAAGMGSVSVGAIAVVLMVFIWYSLPR